MYTTRKEYLPMATLVVFKFPTAEGANTMLYTLEGLQNQQLIEIHDGAVVTWPAGASKPKTKQLSKSVTTGAGAVGAAMGALMGHFANYGIDQGFIDQVRSKITPGTSALFLLETGAVVDRVSEAVKGQQFEIIQTNLSKEQEDKLRADFGE